MRIGIKLVAAAALALLLALPAAALSHVSTPAVPEIPKGLLPQGDVERFEVTIEGNQQIHTGFSFDAAPSVACSIVGSGTLNESWSYQRGKGVVIAFRKLAPGLVVLQRDGRGFGDSAFAVKGSMHREASGSVMSRVPIDCLSFPLKGPACDKTYAVNSNLSLGWEKGKLTLEDLDSGGRIKNPARECGVSPVWNFDELPSSFPDLYKQKAALTLGQIFNSNRSFAIRLKANFLPAADPPAGYINLDEVLRGFTTVTLKRL